MPVRRPRRAPRDARGGLEHGSLMDLKRGYARSYQSADPRAGAGGGNDPFRLPFLKLS
jgi:hypothetical protein